MDHAVSRRMWRSLEPYFGMIFFAPEAAKAYEAIGLDSRPMGYFASRAAPMGAVGADVVIATFFNFNPGLVKGVIPEAWRRATPEKVLEARLEAADAALRRILGDVVESDDMVEAAALAREATTACRTEGRPLFAGHRSLPWPDPPHLVLWHAVALLREHRGDGHVAVMLTEGVGACEALVIHGATGEVPSAVLQASRVWSDEEWAAATASLRERGWLAEDGSLTPAGTDSRVWVEERTDQLALAPWRHLGTERCERLRALVRPWSRAVVESGTFPATRDPSFWA